MQKLLLNSYFPKLKRVRQKTDSYCGPAVIEMLASFIGVSVNQNKLVKLTKIEKKIERKGMDIRDLKKATKIMVPSGIFWYKDKSTIKNLDEIINKYEYPVGVEWQGVFEEFTEKDFPDDGHYGVVTYINQSKNVIFLSDPFRRFAKIDRKFKIDFFKKRWWDINGKIKDTRMMFMITPKDVTFPEKLGMKKV